MPHSLADILTWAVVGFFIFWLIGGFIVMRWVLKQWDEDSE